MSKILAIFGATGQQGGGLIKHILADPQLSAQYTIRAITRDATSPKAMQLKQKGVSVVPADISSPSSLEAAMAGAHTVFIMTPPSFGPSGFQDELNRAKAIADVAVAAGASYLIFSTLPSVREISMGKYTKVAAFDAKAEAEKYIRSLPIKSAFYCPGSFMENLLYPIAIIRRQKPDGTWIWSQQVSGSTKLPLIAATEDTGKFVGAILADPDKYVGSRFCAAAEIYTWDEIVGIVSRVTGKKVVYEPVSVEEYAKILPPVAADVFVEGFLYYQDFGYFGPDTDELVQWAKENARGQLTTFEEWLKAHPLSFE